MACIPSVSTARMVAWGMYFKAGKAILVEQDSYLIELARYVVLLARRDGQATRNLAEDQLPRHLRPGAHSRMDNRNAGPFSVYRDILVGCHVNRHVGNTP